MSGREFFTTASLGLGLLMVGSPWLLAFSPNETAAISACGIGALLMIPALAALLDRLDVAAGSSLTIGAWSLMAPIVLGFAQSLAAMTVHVVAGFAAMLLAISNHNLPSAGPPEIRV